MFSFYMTGLDKINIYSVFVGIKIYFSGNGKSYWDVRKGKHTTKYRARETYLNHFITLFGSGKCIT